ncbi:MAG: hypothetical protein JW809_01695 [Pirellulales bacterium]|nr:hypothetical protein [Pirellulales bacterium]
MSSWKVWTARSLVVLVAAMVIPLCGSAAAGVQVQPPCEGCCSSDCMCYPNVTYWGYFHREWRSRWPGEKRPDIDDPTSIGRKVIATPPGATPVPLPKEEYAEPGTGGLQFQEGPSTGPIAPESPFQLEPEPGGLNLPGGPSLPDEPPPAQLPLEGAPATPPAPTSSTPETWNPPFGPAAPGVAPERSYAFGPVGQEPPMPAAPLAATDLVAMPGRGAATPPTSFQENVETFGPAAPFPSSQAVPRTPISPLPPTAEEQPVPRPALGEADVAPAPAGRDADRSPEEPWAPAPGWKTRRNAEGFPAERRVGYEAPVSDGPSAQAPIGLDGYCPVQLVSNEQWIEGSRQLAVRHEGRTYLISGPAEHRLFRAHPERYAPVLGGCDVVLAADGAGRVAGRTDACVVYEGRLYMFSDQSTLARFRDDPRRFALGPRTGM